MSVRFNNIQILLYPIYWFYVESQKFIRSMNFFSPNEYEKNDKIILNIFNK